MSHSDFLAKPDHKSMLVFFVLLRTFSNFLQTGGFVEEGPTVGLNVKVVKKGGVTMKVRFEIVFPAQNP